MTIAVLWQGIGTALVGAKVPPQLSTFATFAAFFIAAAVSMAAYLVFSHRRTKGANDAKPVMKISTIASLNLYTAGAFCLFYVSTTLMQPTAASVIETGVGPFIIALIIAFNARAISGSLIPATAVLALALAFFFLGNHNSSAHSFLGFALAVGAGVSAVGVLYSSRNATKYGHSVFAIAAARFHLAWIASGLVTFFTVEKSDLEGSIVSIIVLSATCITLPVLLLQWGITLAPPFTSALIIAALPAVVLATEIALGSKADQTQLVLLTLIVCITAGQTLLGARRTNKSPRH